MNINGFRCAPHSARGARCVLLAGVALAMLSAGARAAVMIADAPMAPPAPTLPPAAIVEKPLAPATNDVPDERPSEQHVWIPGHWRWQEGAYVWIIGQWEVPPVPNASWVSPQWETQGSGYVLREGYWQQNPPPPPAAAAQPPTEIAVAQPPPPPVAERIPARPSAAHVWLSGYWFWQDNQFRWIVGHWEVSPRENLGWVPARWETRGDRYVFVAGYWRANSVAAPAVATTTPAPRVVTLPQVIVVAPPPPRHEVVHGRPSPYHVWVPGYWAWRGSRHVWIAGHWERPPRGRHAWVEPRWEHRGGSWMFVYGHWR